MLDSTDRDLMCDRRFRECALGNQSPAGRTKVWSRYASKDAACSSAIRSRNPRLESNFLVANSQRRKRAIDGKRGTSDRFRACLVDRALLCDRNVERVWSDGVVPDRTMGVDGMVTVGWMMDGVDKAKML